MVVQTWDKQFHNSQKEQKVPFLYLANDILQNSKRKGTEFVGEFWKVLPAALKDVVENGDDHGKNAVSRLVCLPFLAQLIFGDIVVCLTASFKQPNVSPHFDDSVGMVLFDAEIFDEYFFFFFNSCL